MRTQKKYFNFMVILLLICFTPFSTAWAQSAVNYRGTVTDPNQEPLIGVSVMIKGTSTGVITNLDGQYSISARQGDVLVFSYVGMKPQEKSLSAELVNDIIMAEEAKGLEEVVW